MSVSGASISGGGATAGEGVGGCVCVWVVVGVAAKYAIEGTPSTFPADWEVEVPYVPFGEDHEGFDGAEGAEAFSLRASDPAEAAAGWGAAAAAAPDDTFETPAEFPPEHVMDGVGTGVPAGAGEVEVPRGYGEEGCREERFVLEKRGVGRVVRVGGCEQR